MLDSKLDLVETRVLSIILGIGIGAILTSLGMYIYPISYNKMTSIRQCEIINPIHDLNWERCIHNKAKEIAPHFETIDHRYWICTSKHVWEHPKDSGTLTRFGRRGEHTEWNEWACDQWSATFEHRDKCSKSNAWCSGTDEVLK